MAAHKLCCDGGGWGCWSGKEGRGAGEGGDQGGRGEASPPYKHAHDTHPPVLEELVRVAAVEHVPVAPGLSLIALCAGTGGGGGAVATRCGG